MDRKMFKRLCLILLLLPPLLSTSIDVRAQGPDQSDKRKLIEALLVELRLLRQTFQRVNLSANRSQILVERIRAQNDKVARLSRAVEDAHEEVADTQVSLSQFNERVKSAENLLQQESDEKRRPQLDQEVREMKYMLDLHKQKDQRAREREQRLSEQLRTEQGKLDDLENRLDALERQIQLEVEQQELNDKKEAPKKP